MSALTQEEMRSLTEAVMFALVRYRATAAELFDPELLAAAKKTRWILGDDGALVACEKMLAAPSVEPLAFYNLMVIAHQLAPEIAMSVSVLRGVDLPKPDPAWVGGG